MILNGNTAYRRAFRRGEHGRRALAFAETWGVSTLICACVYYVYFPVCDVNFRLCIHEYLLDSLSLCFLCPFVLLMCGCLLREFVYLSPSLRIYK